MAIMQAFLLAALTALDVRLNLSPVPNGYGAMAVRKAIRIVPLTAIEVASPVGRFVRLSLVALMHRHLQVIEVLKIVALFSLQEGKNLVGLARGACVFAATLAASISCVLNRVM